MLKFYGADICKDCIASRELLRAQNIEVEFIDITASTANLKAFLSLRDSRPEFDPVKADGSIGIPTFVWEDGTLVVGTGWLQGESRCADC